MSVLLSIHFLPDKVSLKIGDRSPSEIRAPRSATYIDTEATERLAQFAVDRVPSVYDPDPSALAEAERRLSEVFQTIHYVRSDSSQTSARKVERLSSELGSTFPQESLRYLLAASPATLDRLRATAERLVQAAMRKEIRNNTDDLAHIKMDYEAEVRRAVTYPAEIELLKSIGEQTLKPTRIYNRRKTERQQEIARQSIQPVKGEIRVGDVILRKGEVFTQLHLDKCAALGLVNPRIDFPTGASIFAMTAAMVLLVVLYIRRALPRLYANPRHLFLLAGIVVCGVLGLRVFGAVLGIQLSVVQFGYLGMMTVVAAGMLIAVLLNAQLAMLVTALLSVQSGLIMNHDIRFPVMTLLSSLVGIYCVEGIRDRSHLLRAGLAIGFTNVALVWVLGGMLGDSQREMLIGSTWALVSASFAVAIFWFGVAALEKPFGILTHTWLLELSSSERPLLRQLCITAPGTYTHSIMVGNLAEAAAEAIGADTLFCRVASYYHDIGKMRRPHCFIENQRGENIHDRLNPSLSALIIASHVRDGQELADEHKLPRQIRDIIAEHHGTSLIRYFYHQALTSSGQSGHRDIVLEQHFRYEGPRPQTRESGIIMLADTVEAAARCLEKPTPAHLQSLVENLFRDKLMDGQLDECDLTYKELQKIQAAFVKQLSAIFHGRIDYPEVPDRAAKRGSKDVHLYPQLSEVPREDAAIVGGREERPSV